MVLRHDEEPQVDCDIASRLEPTAFMLVEPTGFHLARYAGQRTIQTGSQKN